MPDQIKKNWLESLEPISRFISTHGLAVFLVIYYATVLYPDAMRERATWIEQITELRKAVAPDSRPVNVSQARVIIDIVSESFYSKLEDEITQSLQKEKLNRLRVGQMSDSEGNAGILAGNMTLYIKAKKPLKPQLDEINPKYRNFQFYVLREIGFYIDRAFEKVIRNAQGNTERLTAFNFINGTLYDFWTNFINNHKVWLKKAVTEKYAQDLLRANHEDYLRVIGEHKDYESGCEEPLPESVASYQNISAELQEMLYAEILNYKGSK